MTHSIFNRTDVVAEGWYWLLASRDLKRGQVKAVNLLGHELAVFRGKDGMAAALDAYCPHMGAHLAEGRVEGNELRCFFHNWRFNAMGQCTDIPCLAAKLQKRVQTTAWQLEERNGIIWLWLGSEAASEPVPEAPELAGTQYDFSIGNRFIKHCHPNVVMVNAIDEQHFHTVHNLPGSILSMQPLPRNKGQIEFHNSGTVPKDKPLGRFIARFYKNALTYNLSYWSGTVGTVTLGPDFLHLYLMFALRLTPDGKTEGRTIAFTKQRKGIIGWLFNRMILMLTHGAGYYFAVGDTRIFQTIRFDLKTPIAADRAVLAFIQHLDQQKPYVLAASAASAKKAM